MKVARHKEIMSHAAAQFKPQWIALADQHSREMRESQFRARQTHNSGAVLPAEAACYVSHARALVVGWAKCVADAFTAFGEPVGREVHAELSKFFAATVATRKSSFQAQAELRRMRTGNLGTQTQLTGLLRGFELNASSALLEARAILGKQRVEIGNRPQRPVLTKYVVDTYVFNWLADSSIKRASLPSDGGFAITHIQVDEINKTKDEERRARLFLLMQTLHCELLPTQTFVFDVSRVDQAKPGDGRLFTSLKTQLDGLNKGKKSNSRDALIAETTIANGYVLLTADRDLRLATVKHGGKVVFFARRQRRTPSTAKP
jgi:hypothetical protein